MRVPDVVIQIRRRINEGTNFIRHPAQVISQAVYKRLQSRYENLTLPFDRKPQKLLVQEKQSVSSQREAQNTTQQETRFTSDTNQSLTSRDTSSVPTSVNPGTPDQSLPTQLIIKSRWNSYTIEKTLEQVAEEPEKRQRVALYNAKTRSDEPVLVKEYQLFEQDFSSEEIEKRQKAFERLIELNLKIGNGPDFRIVKLVDAIVLPREQHCYLVTRPINHNTTLKAYLAEYSKMSPMQVREALRQILETLRFLHQAYRVYFPTGESERGLPHGNISLNSLLIRHVGSSIAKRDRQFFIYLTDLALWEHLFYPPASRRHREIAKSSSALGTVNQDLTDLGWVGFRLAGGTVTGQPADIQTDPVWQELNDQPLQQYIYRLLGLESPFRTAEEALRALPDLLQLSAATSETSIPIEDTEKSSFPTNSLVLMAVLLSLGLLGLLSWFLLKQIIGINETAVQKTVEQLSEVTTIEQVNDVPPAITYVVEPGGAWDFAFDRTFLPYDVAESSISRQNIMTAIRCQYPDLKLTEITQLISEDYSNNTDTSTNADRCRFSSTLRNRQRSLKRPQLFEQIQSGEAQVGFVRLGNDVPATLQQQPVAYDALVVFVPFGDPYRSRNTVGTLKGTVTLAELQQLYTGDRDIAELRGHSVKLFFSEDDETAKLFEQMVLNNNPEQVRKFRQLRQQALNREKAAARTDRQPQDIYNRMWVDFNKDNQDTIGIGFDRLGRMFDQCSVYPLAIKQGAQKSQVLMQSNGQPVNENTDLCGAKGSYFPNVEGYSLKYDLGMVFVENSVEGKKMAEMLNTTEGQYLMSEVGLVPTQPIHKLLSAIWDRTSE